LYDFAEPSQQQKNSYTFENKKIQPVFTAGNFNKALGTLAGTCIAIPAPLVEGVSGLQ